MLIYTTCWQVAFLHSPVSTLLSTGTATATATGTGTQPQPKKKKTRRGRTLDQKVHQLRATVQNLEKAHRNYREASDHERRTHGIPALQQRVNDLRDDVLRKSALLMGVRTKL